MNIKKLFLAGMERSGTTWLGKIFDSNLETFYLHEPDNWNVNPIKAPFVVTEDEAKQYSQEINRSINNILDTSVLRVYSKQPIFKKSYQSGFLTTVKKTLFLLLRAMKLKSIPGSFKKAVVLNGCKGSTLVWKSVESIARLGSIMNADKELLCVFIVRHPCGYIASILRGEKSGKFRSNNETSEDFDIFQQLMNTSQAKRYDLTFEKLKELTPLQRLCWRWVIINEKAMDELSNKSRGLIVKYDDLCHDVLAITKQMYDFTGLELDQQTREFLNVSTEKQDAAYYSVYKNSVNASEKWKKELDDSDIVTIENIVKATRPGELFYSRSDG